jgi:cytoskeletal protein CcmA (bactofilin family)
MFGGSKKGNRAAAKINTLIGRDTEIHGDVIFKGGLHLDGIVKGDVKTGEDELAVLTVGVGATIEGNVYVPTVILDGNVIGDVHAAELVELAPNARINGDIFYNRIEMAMGAAVNGKLVHIEDSQQNQEKAPVRSAIKKEIEEEKIRAVENVNS